MPPWLSDPTAPAWFQAVGSFGAILVAVFVLRSQNRAARAIERRAATERANVVRACLAAEIKLLQEGIAAIIKDDPPESAAGALSTLGTLKMWVYRGLIPQLGVLGSELAGQIVGLYVNLEHLIERGQEIEFDLVDPADQARQENSAREWLGQLRTLHETMSQTLTELRKAPPPDRP